MTFTFPTILKSQQFCERIARLMTLLYDIPTDQAVATVNECWGTLDLTDPFCIVYHETEPYWAGVLGNENPYLAADHPKQVAWRDRYIEAMNRLAKLEVLDPTFLQKHPNDWPSLNC